jgi:arylsulfatase A-like enzyme
MLAALILVAAVQPVRQNFVWISFDGAGTQIGAYGDDAAQTPAIDALAARGIRFERAFATSAAGAPSRAAAMTGVHPLTLGAMHDTGPALPPAGVRPFTELLRAEGYWCTSAGAPEDGLALPRTAWDDSGPDAHWRSRPSPSQPFFARFHLDADPEGEPDPQSAAIPPYWPDAPEIRQAISRHAARMTAIDRKVKAILGELERDRLAAQTTIFLWSSSGWPLPRGQGWLYEAGTRIPLIIAEPGSRPEVRDDLASLIDLAPTCLALAGIERQDWMEGRVILGYPRGIEPPALLLHRDRVGGVDGRIRALLSRDWLYIRNLEPEAPRSPSSDPAMQAWQAAFEAGRLEPEQSGWFGRRSFEELYDLRSDPHQLKNLAEAPEARGALRELRFQYRRWERSGPDPGAEPEESRLARLFPGGRAPQAASPTLRLGSEGIILECETPGASIAWRWEGEPRWRLYVRPILPAPGRARSFEARASRSGWRESAALLAAAG